MFLYWFAAWVNFGSLWSVWENSLAGLRLVSSARSYIFCDMLQSPIQNQKRRKTKLPLNCSQKFCEWKWLNVRYWLAINFEYSWSCAVSSQVKNLYCFMLSWLFLPGSIQYLGQRIKPKNHCIKDNVKNENFSVFVLWFSLSPAQKTETSLNFLLFSSRSQSIKSSWGLCRQKYSTRWCILYDNSEITRANCYRKVCEHVLIQ